MLQVDIAEQDAPSTSTSASTDSALTFVDLSKEKGPKISSAFAIDKIVTYLSTMTASLPCADSSDDECADVGTKKPVVKGRRMYNSEKLGMCEGAVQSDCSILYRANCDASLRRQLCRYPQVTVDTNGDIVGAQCTCEASSDGRCCHIAAVLYLMVDRQAIANINSIRPIAQRRSPFSVSFVSETAHEFHVARTADPTRSRMG